MSSGGGRTRCCRLPIFGIRLFSAVNAVTVCVYAAFGGFFFLAVLQLQVVVGYSALAAGTALLPTTVLMLLLSARSGQLGQRIGPRIPLTVGPLLCAVGMLLMTRVGRGASYFADVLPALLVLGAGMVTLVAPLTSTVLASVDVDRAGLASGINNAAARAASLVAVAALPLLAGIGTGGLPLGGRIRRGLPAGHAAVRGHPGDRRADRPADRTQECPARRTGCRAAVPGGDDLPLRGERTAAGSGRDEDPGAGAAAGRRGPGRPAEGA